MACKQEFFILISCIFLNVFCYELQFEGCGINGWSCSNTTNGKIDVVFKCPHELLLKEKHDILWGFKGLPASTQAVTIEDCETSVSVTVDTLQVASVKYPNLSSFVIKDIAELIINESTFGVPELLRGVAAVKFENIKLIKSFNKNSIGGNVFSGNGTSMTSFNFEMKNVQINNIKNRAIWWTEGEIPFTMLWDNVSVNVIEEDAIHISDTKKNPNSTITINNCKLGEIKRKAFNIRSTDFQFTDNDVDLLEKSAFRIQSGKTAFIRNNFFKINNFAFLFVNVGTGAKNLKFESNTIHQADKLSMNFGAPYYNEVNGKISFRDNKFNCINSTWLQRGENEKIETKGGEEEEVQYYKYLKKIEKSVLDSNENTCINLPCSITVSKFKDLYAKNGPMKSYCN